MTNFQPGSLDGVTVIDFTTELAGPLATRHLADMGAKVIKVEAYKGGAAERHLGYQVTHDGVTQSSGSIHVNRGKNSICIDFQSPEGLKVIQEMIKKADVMVESFAPGIAESLKLDYESVKKIKEDIIYCSVSCFGNWGPDSHRPGSELIAQAASGWTSRGIPVQIAATNVCSHFGAFHAVLGINGALFAREEKGIGQHIDISMVDCQFTVFENAVPWYALGKAVGKEILPAKGNSRLSSGYAPYGIYEGKDGLIAIAVLSDSRWEPLVNIMGPNFAWLLTDERLKDVYSRNTNTAVINEAVDKWVAESDSVYEIQRLVESVDVSCAVAKTIEELVEDEHILARDMLPIVEQPFIGPMKMVGNPIKFSETPSCIRGYSPFLGEQNKKVLADVLGYSDEQVKALYSAGVLYHEPAVERLT